LAVSKIEDPQNGPEAFQTVLWKHKCMIQIFVDPHFFEINIVDPQNGLERCLKCFVFF